MYVCMYENLHVSKTGAQKPHASAYVCDQDNVDRELYGSYFTNAIAQVVLQIGEKTWNLRKVSLELADVCITLRAVS